MATLLAWLGCAAAKWVIGGIAAVVILGGGWLVVKRHYYNQGWNAALAGVAAKDAKAVQDATVVQRIVSDCFNRGGQWKVEDGKCSLD